MSKPGITAENCNRKDNIQLATTCNNVSAAEFQLELTLTCNVCNKIFQTRFSYNRHISRHTDVNKHQCDKCGKVFARRDNFVRHLQNKHGSENNAQIGYGSVQLDEPVTKRQKLSNNGRDFYQVTNIIEVDMKKFKTKGIQYSVKFKNDLDIHDLTTILSILHKVFYRQLDGWGSSC
ncbi:fez family zinc finger protein 1-like [Anneissia japonica]|uniref:fez family zinc finger protein 1-like n=1 Tax=Anneissia japonica TaxID=1529436 RepID=UPI001425A40D|nr:fez family zinc finger protein 1-like [Anneissia japonica]